MWAIYASNTKQRTDGNPRRCAFHEYLCSCAKYIASGSQAKAHSTIFTSSRRSCSDMPWTPIA